LEFRFYNDKLAKKPKLSVDGLVPTSIHFSHFKGNRTPPKYKADTGTAICLKVAEDSSFDRERVPICTNDHYDTDGVLSVWAMCIPEDALLEKDMSIRAAESGDFHHYSTDEAFAVDATVEGYRHSPDSPYRATVATLDAAGADGYVYQKLSHMLPDLWQDLDRHRFLWQKPLEDLHRDFDAFKSKQFSVKEHWDDWLSVVEGPYRPLPMAVDRFCQGRVFLMASPAPGGKGNSYAVDYAYYSWADTPGREKVHWVDFAPLASALNERDRGEGQWQTKWDGRGKTSQLRYAGATGASVGSTLTTSDVTAALREHLKTAPKVEAASPA
jgi:hypothetical protein